MQDEKYNEIYRKAEEKFFEDLKYYPTKNVSEEQIKRLNLKKESIERHNRDAKKYIIFHELVKYLCKDGKILIAWSPLLNKKMDLLKL